MTTRTHYAHCTPRAGGRTLAAVLKRSPGPCLNGSKKWFRAATTVEAHWWRIRDKIFDGPMPEPVTASRWCIRTRGLDRDLSAHLNHQSSRTRRLVRLRSLPTASQQVIGCSWHCNRFNSIHTHNALPILLLLLLLSSSGHPSPRLSRQLCLQARASFAVEKALKEVTSMMRNQQDIRLNKILRAISLAQVLVNDPTEAHKVLLQPQIYPQY